MASAPLDAAFAHRLLGPYTAEDAAGGGLALALIDALTLAARPLWYFAEDPGAAQWLTSRLAPLEWLPWMARISGAELTRSMTEAKARDEVETPASRGYGAPGKILAAILPHLQEPRRVVTYRRAHPSIPGDRPGDFTVVIHPSDVIDGHEDALARDAELAAWDGLRLHIDYVSGRTWNDLIDEAPTWSDAQALHATWRDAVDG